MKPRRERAFLGSCADEPRLETTTNKRKEAPQVLIRLSVLQEVRGRWIPSATADASPVLTIEVEHNRRIGVAANDLHIIPGAKEGEFVSVLRLPDGSLSVALLTSKSRPPDQKRSRAAIASTRKSSGRDPR
jgi:hypothetical protein